MESTPVYTAFSMCARMSEQILVQTTYHIPRSKHIIAVEPWDIETFAVSTLGQQTEKMHKYLSCTLNRGAFPVFPVTYRTTVLTVH
jgi:hypothetical protein